jgi:hypothetical protein
MYINYTFVIEREEPCEGRLSSTVPREREGETPLRDPTIGKAGGRANLKLTTQNEQTKTNK